nr:metal-dependent hydrolase [Haloarcula sp. CBA1131]
MFVGHALFAFALGGLAAWWLGLSRERAVQLGVIAGLFAAVPDVDIVYAPFGLLVGAAENLTADGFWETANVVHRGPTHSLLLGRHSLSRPVSGRPNHGPPELHRWQSASQRLFSQAYSAVPSRDS